MNKCIKRAPVFFAIIIIAPLAIGADDVDVRLHGLSEKVAAQESSGSPNRSGRETGLTVQLRSIEACIRRGD